MARMNNSKSLFLLAVRPSNAELASARRGLQDRSPDQLLAAAERSLGRACVALDSQGCQTDPTAFAQNLAWAYVALQQLVVPDSRLQTSGGGQVPDIMQAVRDIARGA